MASDSSPTKWVIPEHTRAKHTILRLYLRGWYAVIGQTAGRVVFLDGFAGRGIYHDGSPGSPIIALTELLEHRVFPRLADRQFVFVFVEKNPCNVASLREEIEKFKGEHQPWPPNVKTEVIEAEFAEVAEDIVRQLRGGGHQMAPLFAFVDPFGFGGLAIHTLAALTSWPRAELCVNFAANNVNRFLEQESVQPHIEALFGCTVEDILAGWSGAGSRLSHVRDAYARQLQICADFPYVQSFEMRNESGNVSYYLYHATRHEKGVELMKDAMWKVNPAGEFRFSDRLAGQEVLFQIEANLKPLRDHLVEHFQSRGPTAIALIKTHVTLYTPYRTPHLTAVLREMEKAGQITVQRPGRHGFPEGTTIAF
ncbi:three-Cys-motif partner protein TcmP [Georgenia sp. M64]|uniref:three-Cys-motif partner protein TcmP n=1 Tax=Georgenia sp. M64 TaxID=3120520 RepID=UPI0030E4F76A